jgi:hypothetical protein
LVLMVLELKLELLVYPAVLLFLHGGSHPLLFRPCMFVIFVGDRRGRSCRQLPGADQPHEIGSHLRLAFHQVLRPNFVIRHTVRFEQTAKLIAQKFRD